MSIDWAVPSAACQNYPQKSFGIRAWLYRLLKKSESMSLAD